MDRLQLRQAALVRLGDGREPRRVGCQSTPARDGTEIAMAEVLLDKATKRYGDHVAVNELSLHCNDSEFFFILGPSGAGKTSTLKMIAGLTTVDGGQIRIGNRLVNDLEPRLRNVAMAFESYALYPHLTVFENIAFPLRAPIRAKQFSEADVRARVQRVGDLLRMSEL